MRSDRRIDWLWGLFGFALMTAYWPGISGVASTPRWAVAISLAAALFLSPRIRMTLAHWLGLLLVGWLLLSLSWNDGGQDGFYDGIEASFELALAATAFAIASMVKDLRPLFLGAALGIAVNSAFCIAQRFGFDMSSGLVLVRDQGMVAGLFYEKDRLAAVTALVAIGVIALRMNVWLLLTLMPSLLLTNSRGAYVALAVGVMAANRRAKQLFIVAAILGVSLVVLLPVFHVLGPSDRERLAMWSDTVLALDITGHGLGSFREDFIRFAHAFDFSYWQSRPEHPHNEWLWLVFEGGLPGLGLALCFAASLWRAGKLYAERGILAGLFVLSLVAMPLHDPATFIVGACVAGALAGRHALDRIVFSDCRDPLCPWLADLNHRRQLA